MWVLTRSLFIHLKVNYLYKFQGYYRFELLTIKAENVPENFPFTEGRMYYNLSKQNKVVAGGTLDFQLCTLN